MVGKINRFLRPLHKTKLRKFFVGLTAVLIASVTVLYYAGSPVSAAVTVTTSTTASATSHSQERKNWYDGARYWVGMLVSNQLQFWYCASTDDCTNNANWHQNASATVVVTGGGSAWYGFSVLGDSSNAFLETANYSASLIDGPVSTFTATGYPSTSFSWGAGTNLDDGSSGDPNYPTLSRDASGYIHACYIFRLGGNYDWKCAKSTNTNDVTAFGAATTLKSNTNVNKFGDVAPLAGGGMYSAYIDNTTIQGNKYSGTSWNSLSTPLGVGTSGATNNLSMLGSTSADETYMSYIDSGGKTQFRKYIDDANSTFASTIDDSDNPGAIPGNGRDIVRTSNGDIYAGIKVSTTCEVWKSTDNGVNWSEVDSAHHPSCNVTGAPMSLAVDGTDKIHVAYFDAGVKVKYNTITSSTWGTAEDVTPSNFTCGTANNIDIAIDSSNVPHIIYDYYDGSVATLLKYANRTSSAWQTVVQITSLSISKTVMPSLSFDNSSPQKPIISYIDSQNSFAVAVRGNANNATSFATDTKTLDLSGVNTTAGQEGSSIATDSSGNIWFAYVDGTTIKLFKHLSANGWSTWSSEIVGSTGSEPSIAVSGNMVYVLSQDNTNFVGVNIYNDDTATWSGIIGPSPLQSGVNQDAHIRWASNADNTSKPLDLMYSDGTDIHYTQMGVWRPVVTLDSNSGNAYTSLSTDTSSGILISYWIRSNQIYCSTASSPYTSWTSCNGGSSIYNPGTTITWLSSSLNQTTSCKLGTTWTEGAGPTYNIRFDNSYLSNCSPGAPSVISPADGTTVTPTTPPIVMKSVDSEGDTIKYRIYIFNTSARSGGNCTGTSFESADQSSSGTGWDNGTTAYASNTNATYTVQSTMTRGSSYCWQAQAKDPGGTNSFGSLSTASTFTINSIPSTPTLLLPTSSSVQKSINPIFTLGSTDVDSDYLRYDIKAYTTQTECNADSATNLVRDIEQNAGGGIGTQTGWSRQDTDSSHSYASTASSYTTAYYIYQNNPLTPNTTYWWKGRAIDPAGSNTYSSWATCLTFTTASQEVRLQGGLNIRGGTNIR